jgi:bacterioferritin-associated ferredoxin
MTKFTAQVKWPGRFEASLVGEFDDLGQVRTARLEGVGGPRFLEGLKRLRGQLKGDFRALSIGPGRTPEEIFLRELLARAKGEWHPPVSAEELCHCRAVPTAVVDQAICTGAHTSKKVSEQTSASTACGTCRPDVEALLRFRLP